MWLWLLSSAIRQPQKNENKKEPLLYRVVKLCRIVNTYISIQDFRSLYSSHIVVFNGSSKQKHFGEVKPEGFWPSFL